MRIWLLPSAFLPHRGGVEEATLQLGRALKERGHEVLIVTNRHPPDLAPEDVVEGLPVVRLSFAAPSMSSRSVARFALTFPRVVRSMLATPHRPEIVHVQCASSQLAFAVAFVKLSRANLVLTTQGETSVDADQLFQRSLYARLSLRTAARSAHAITACSAWTARHAEKIASPLGSATIIPNGIDPSQWQVTEPADAPVVATWGRHVRQKGLDLLMDAWPAVRAEIPSARLVIGGSGPDTPALVERGMPGVEFVGSLDRRGVADLLSRSRVVVVPSREEPFGIVALEAMASGRGVVWSTHGGLSEATGGLGWPADPANSHGLAQSILQALNSPGAPQLYREHAESFSWTRIVDQYLDVYRAVTDRKVVR